MSSSLSVPWTLLGLASKLHLSSFFFFLSPPSWFFFYSPASILKAYNDEAGLLSNQYCGQPGQSVASSFVASAAWREDKRGFSVAPAQSARLQAAASAAPLCPAQGPLCLAGWWAEPTMLLSVTGGHACNAHTQTLAYARRSKGTSL